MQGRRINRTSKQQEALAGSLAAGGGSTRRLVVTLDFMILRASFAKNLAARYCNAPRRREPSSKAERRRQVIDQDERLLDQTSGRPRETERLVVAAECAEQEAYETASSAFLLICDSIVCDLN